MQNRLKLLGSEGALGLRVEAENQVKRKLGQMLGTYEAD